MASLRPPGPSAPPRASAAAGDAPPSPLEQMRRQCAAEGLCAEWSADEQQLASLLKQLREWTRFGVYALKAECQVWRIPIENVYEKEDLLLRLRTVLVWRSMSVKQLRDECWRRSIQNFDAVGDDRERAGAMLVGRLLADAFGSGAPRGPGRSPAGESHSSWPPWTGKAATASPPPQPAAGDEAKAEDGNSSTDSDDAERRGEPPSWRRCGPRVKRMLREEFEGFQGDPPGSDAEETWTDQELRSYFYSGGQIRPGRRPPPRAARPSARRPVDDSLERQLRVLGLTAEDATADAARRAYRKLALQLHPDKQPEESDATRFREVKEAYDAVCQRLKF